MSYPGNNQPQQPYGTPPQGGYPPPQQQGYPDQQQAPQQQPYGGPQPGGPQYGGPQYGGPQHGGPHGPQGPQYGGPPAPKKSKTGVVILAIAGAVVVVVALIVFGLNRAGVIGGGPLPGGGVPSVPPPSQLPKTAGDGLYLIEDDIPGAFTAPKAKYDWVVARYYATKPAKYVDEKTTVYVVTVYGPLGDAKDALTTRNNVTEVGSGYCADGSAETPLRVCGVNSGSIVVTVTDTFGKKGRTATDDQLISYATDLAGAMS